MSRTIAFRCALAPLLAASLIAAQPAFAKERSVQSDEAEIGIVQDYNPAPAMWVLKDEDTTIYMLGTIHLLPAGFRWRNSQLDGIVESVDELVLESTDEESSASLERLGSKMVAYAEARRPTSEQLSPAVRHKWRSLIENSGMPFEETDSLPVMVALLGFGFSGVEESSSSYDYGVETILEEEFHSSNRPVSGIEDFGYVMLSLFRSRDKLVIHDLESMLSDWSGKAIDPLEASDSYPDEDGWGMEHAWARGELQDVMDLGYGPGKLGARINTLLLTNRNRAWAEWLDQRLDQPGSILLAVGAGHFEGEHSVLQMLKARGLEAERIN